MMALSLVENDHSLCFPKIHNPDTMELIKFTKPVFSRKLHFQRFFMSFTTKKYRFVKGSRLFISLDGCHLKVNFYGVMLTIVGLDTNNGMFSTIVCIYECETIATWT